MRLDSALVERALSDSRTKARRRIESGDVVVNGAVVTKPSHPVYPHDVLEVRGDKDDVGRGARKLRAALQEWGISAQGRVCLDIGASTGGFTQVLLESGAERVVALDVGRDQLHPRVKEDPRVVSFDNINIREVDRDWWEKHAGPKPSLVVVDVSFISLTQVLPPVVKELGATEWVALVKPQFEVGRTGVSEGIVKAPGLREKALIRIVDCAGENGLMIAGIMRSPITGESGNVEYLCWLSPTHGRNQTQWSEQIHTLTHS